MARDSHDDKKSGPSRRDQRLKAALRENLRRRKAQARGRVGDAKSGPETPPDPVPPKENGR
jgi:hypothetical protein